MARVGILVEDLYQDLEVWYPLLRLREAGHQAMVIGTGKPLYKSKHGYEIQPDVEAKQVKASDLDGLVIPGGYAPDILRRYPEVVKLVRDVFQQGKVVGSICHGPWLLCSAEVLKGKIATCFFAIKDDVVHAGAKYVDQEVVVDGNLITSRKPDDLPAFMREILTQLERHHRGTEGPQRHRGTTETQNRRGRSVSAIRSLCLCVIFCGFCGVM